MNSSITSGQAARCTDFRRGLIHRADKVLVQLVGEERHGGRDQLGDRHQRGVQRGVGSLLVGTGVVLPEAAAGAAHVPGGESLHEFFNGTGGVGDIIFFVGFGHIADEDVQLGEQPAVQIIRGGSDGQALWLVEVGIGHEERIHIPKRQRETADHVANQIGREAALLPGRRGGVEIPAQRIGAVQVDDIPRLDDVAQRLGHLASLRILNVTEADDVLERDLIVEQGARWHEANRTSRGFGQRLRRCNRLDTAP